MIKGIILNVLTAFYQPFWAAFVSSFTFMYLYLFAFDTENGNKGWVPALKIWIFKFKSSSRFRSLFFLAFYEMLVLFKTILNRSAWINPLRNVFGGWWFWEEKRYEGSGTRNRPINYLQMNSMKIL